MLPATTLSSLLADGHGVIGAGAAERLMPEGPPAAERAPGAAPARSGESLLPSPGTTLLVVRRYPGGAVALLVEGNRQVLFPRLQEALDLS